MSNIAFVLNLCCIIIYVTIVCSSKLFLNRYDHTFTQCCAITKPIFEDCEIKAAGKQSDHLCFAFRIV